MPMTRKLAGSLVIAVVVALTAATPALAQQLQKVRALMPVRAADESFSPFMVAKHMGYFKDEGLDVDLIMTGGSNEVAIQISAGNGDVGMSTPGESIVGMQSGQLKLRYYYDGYYKSIWSITVPVDSPVKTTADLKGKKLGVMSMGSAGITFGNAMLRNAGMTERDAVYLPIGVGSQAMTSLRQNMVDALVFPDFLNTRFDLAGLKLRTLPAPEKMVNLPDASLLARPDMIEKNPKMLVGFARAIAKGYDFTMANPRAAVLISWKVYPEAKPANLSDDDAIKLGITTNQKRMAIWNSEKTNGKHGLFIKEDWEELIRFLVQEKVLPAPVALESVYTNQFIGEINTYDRAAVEAQAKAFDVSTLK